MSDIFRCENCRFSAPAPVNDRSQKEFGNIMCWRYPPKHVYDAESGAIKSAPIPVNHNWWCGEWKTKEPLRLAPINVDELLNNPFPPTIAERIKGWFK